MELWLAYVVLAQEEVPDHTENDCECQHSQQNGLGVAALLLIARLKDGLAGFGGGEIARRVLQAAVGSRLDGLHGVGGTRRRVACIGLLACVLGALLVARDGALASLLLGCKRQVLRV